MAKHSAQEKEQTKEKLVESAMSLFMKNGYAKTTLEDIVKNVGLTRGAFYWNYKEKKDLLLEIEKRYNSVIQNYFRIEEKESPYESLKSMIIRYLDQRVNSSNDFLYFIRYRIEAETELNDLTDRQKQLDVEVLEEIEKQITKGKEAGEFEKEVDAQKAAFYLYTNLVGIGTLTTTHRGQDGLQLGFITDDLEDYADFLLKGIQRQ